MTNYNHCKLCNRKIEGTSYNNKVYCSGKCRHYAYMVRKGRMTLTEAEIKVDAEINSLKKEGGLNGTESIEENSL